MWFAIGLLRLSVFLPTAITLRLGSALFLESGMPNNYPDIRHQM